MARIFKNIERPRYDRPVRPEKLKGRSVYRSLKIILGPETKKRTAPSRAKAGYPQRCIVKAKFYKGQASAKKQLRYIVREGAGRDGAVPERMGSEVNDMIPRDNKEVQFRFIISPDSPKADLEELVKRAVKLMEAETGESLYWMAAAHYNTQHPHVHIVVRGVSKDNNKVFFPRKFIRQGLRTDLQKHLTLTLGARFPDIDEAYRKEASASRLTRLDAIIDRIENKGRVTGFALDCISPQVSPHVYRRLNFFASHGLATRSGLSFTLTPAWREMLKTASIYDTYLKAVPSLQYSKPDEYRVYTADMGEITGRISAISRLTELDDYGTAIVVENANGAFFVPLRKPLKGGARGIVVTIKPRQEAQVQAAQRGPSRVSATILEASQSDKARLMSDLKGRGGASRI